MLASGKRLRKESQKRAEPSTSVNFFPVAASSSVITPSAGPSSTMVSPAKWRRAILRNILCWLNYVRE